MRENRKAFRVEIEERRAIDAERLDEPALRVSDGIVDTIGLDAHELRGEVGDEVLETKALLLGLPQGLVCTFAEHRVGEEIADEPNAREDARIPPPEVTGHAEAECAEHTTGGDEWHRHRRLHSDAGEVLPVGNPGGQLVDARKRVHLPIEHFAEPVRVNAAGIDFRG